MMQRQRQSLFSRRPARRNAPPTDGVYLRPDQTVPGLPPPRPVDAEEPTILGFPVDETDDDLPPAPEASPEPVLEDQVRVVALPRADLVAGIALVLAGVAAAASMVLPWQKGLPETGSSLVRRGL